MDRGRSTHETINILLLKNLEEKTKGRPRCGYENTIKMNLKCVCYLITLSFTEIICHP